MTGSRTSLLGGGGIYILGDQVENSLAWFYRNQPDHDFGIDGQIESAVDDRPSGRLLAVQLKSSRTSFSDSAEGGWWHRVSAAHARYWLGHSLPVALVLIDLTGRHCYWQHVTSETLVSTGKNFKIWVPAANDVLAARAEWTRIINGSVEREIANFQLFLESLPPTTAKDLQDLAADDSELAAQLAAFLSSHRSDIRKTVESVLLDHLGWLEQGGLRAWIAVAHFAQEHGLYAQAANAFEGAASYASDPADMYATAASLIGSLDPRKAARLLEKARSASPNSILVAAADLSLSLGGHGTAEPAAAQIDRLRFASDNESALFMLAGAAMAARDETEAIRLYEAALARMPNASDAMVRLAECYCRRALGPGAVPGDLTSAVRWGERALEQRRRWTSDTAAALLVVVRALALQSKFAEALEAGAPPPFGTATSTESTDVHLARVMVEMARDGGRPELREPIVDAVSDDSLRQRLRVESNLDELPDPEWAAALNALVATTDEEDVESLMPLLFPLATLGVDRAELIAEAASKGVVPAYYPRLLSAMALSASDVDAAAFELKRLADFEPTAALTLSSAYARRERLEDALEVVRRASSKFSGGDFIAREVQYLANLDRIDEAAARMKDAIQEGRVSGQLLHDFLLGLGQYYAEKSDFSTAATYFQRTAATSAAAAWDLVRCEFELGHFQTARATISRYSLQPSSDHPNRVRLWLSVCQMTEVSVFDATTACDLAGELAEQDPELALALASTVVSLTRGVGETSDEDVGSSVDARPRVPGELHRRAFGLIAEIDSQSVTGFPMVIRGSDGDGELNIEAITELARPRDPGALRSLVRSVQAGVFPLAVLSDALSKPYAHVLTLDGIGMPVASVADAETHALENDAARVALQEPGLVVVDLSAIHLSLQLGEFDRLRLAFRDVLLTMTARRDVARSLMEARSFTASSGSLGWDEFSGKPRFSEIDPADQLRSLKRAETMEAAAEVLTARRPDEAPSRAQEYVEAVGHATWVEPMELADQLQAPLWSDDVAQRRFASSVGIPTFGTVNLLEAMLLREWDGSNEPGDVDRFANGQAELVRRLVHLGVVEQPCSTEELVSILESADGPGRAYCVLTRPAWWQQQESITGWTRIRRAVNDYLDTDAKWEWLQAALLGVAATTAGQGNTGSQLLAALAFAGFESEPTVNTTARALHLADRVATEFDLPRPSGFLEQAVQAIDGGQLLDDLATFVAAVRSELDAIEQ